MCDCHSPSSISRRGLAGLFALGAGLASAPLPAAAQDGATTLCLMCIDHKFVHGAFDFFETTLGTGKYDVVALAGASLAGISPRNGRRISFASTRATLLDHLRFAQLPLGKGRHPGIERVVVLDHLKCGAYENEYGEMTRDQEIVRHREVAQRVGPWLHTLGLSSHFWLIKDVGAPPAPYPYNG